MRAGKSYRLGPLATAVSILITAAIARGAPPEDVSEIARYRQIYQLDIPDNAAFDVNPVPYGVDASDTVFPEGIDRVAYFLELDDGTGRRWIWVSMDAFTQDLKQIGVPTRSSGAMWQRTVAAMNVESNVAGIVTGTGISTGNIEFWPYNYGVAAVLPGIGGSSLVYDFNDFNELANNYGSMQIHNFGAGQTLLAYNDWGGNPTYTVDDVGIGNNAAGVHPDWTFQRNATSFSRKRLEVWVRPTPTVPALGPSGLGVLALLVSALGLGAKFNRTGGDLQPGERRSRRLHSRGASSKSQRYPESSASSGIGSPPPYFRPSSASTGATSGPSSMRRSVRS